MREEDFRKRLKGEIKPPESIDPSVIEVVDYEYKRDEVIEIIQPEFTSVCPRTGLPDFGRIIIRYTPDKKIIELKSLKYYFLQYRQVGSFYEHLVNRILDDLVKLSEPKYMEVIGEFNPRGGMITKVRVEYRREKGKRLKVKG